MIVKDEPYSTVYVENLLGGLNEWRNIQDIVRMTIKALCEVVRSQGSAIKDLEKQIISKASKIELNSGLNIKANVADVMRTFSEVASSIELRPTSNEIQSVLDEKVSKNDLDYILSTKPNLEDINSLLNNKVGLGEIENDLNSFNTRIHEIHQEFNEKISLCALTKELNQVFCLIEEKANLNDVNEILNTKANKESVIAALQRKANKVDVEILLNTKLDKTEFEILSQLQRDFNEITQQIEKINHKVDSKSDRTDLYQINTSLNLKGNQRDLDMINESLTQIKSEYSKRIDDIDQDIDRLIENIRKEFQSTNACINEVDSRKIEFSDWEKINMSISKKVEVEMFSNALTQTKSDLFESLNKFKNEFHQNKKIYEDNLNDKLLSMDKVAEKTHDELNRFREKLNEFGEWRKSDQDEIMKNFKGFITSYSKEVSTEHEIIKRDMQRISVDLEDINASKADKRDYENFKAEIKTQIRQKADINEVESFLKSIHREIEEKAEKTLIQSGIHLKSFENDIVSIIDKKADVYDVTNWLNNKADLNAMNQALQSKVSYHETEGMKFNLEKLNKDLIHKIDYDKFNNYIAEVRLSIDELQKEVTTKSNIKDTISIYKNKADIDDVNKALTQIHEELDLKCSVLQFDSAMDRQSQINETLCGENCVARWLWKSGQVKSGYAIPWEIQTVNTAPDNYVWEKDKTAILVVSPGIYQFTIGFYSNKKPTVQLLINGEPTFSAINSNSYILNHNGGKLKSSKNPTITGLTLCDYITIPERSRLAISYSCEETGEGFLSLKKL